MNRKEELRLREIETQLSKLNHTLEGLTPIFHQVDRKIRIIKFNMKILEDEKARLTQGQFVFGDPIDF